MPDPDTTTDEVWKPVHCEPFSAHYSVSNLGRVRRDSTGRILKPNISRSYKLISFQISAHKKTYAVHSLVAFAFLGAPPSPIGNRSGDYQSDHINSDRRDNRAENLQWVTLRENQHLASLRGRKPHGANHPMVLHPERRATGNRNGAYTHPESMRRGESHSRAKVTDEQVRTIRRLAAEGIAHWVIAEQFHLRQSTTSAIIAYQTWKHVDPEGAAAYAPKSRKEIKAQHAATHPRGERHGKAKLTADDVRMIRQLAAQGHTQKAIGEQFGINKATAASVIKRKTWRHIE